MRVRPEHFRFSLSELADLICQYIRDGERTEKRDVLDWWRWLEKKCGVTEPHIKRFGKVKKP